MSAFQKWVCCIVSGGLFLVWAAAHATEQPNKAETAHSAKIRQLLEERHDVLQNLVEVYERGAKAGRMPPRKLAKATTAMLNAEADLCADDSARIGIYEKMVEVLRRHEASAVRSRDAGRADVGDVWKARLARVKAEIKLEKMKSALQASQ